MVRQIGLPPLVGFLAAGFFINFIGPGFGMPVETGPILDYVAELGVLLLLFTIGLKLKLRQITEPQVIGGARIGYRWDNRTVALWSRNITNTVGTVSAIDFNNLSGIFNQPRTYGVELGWRF